MVRRPRIPYPIYQQSFSPTFPRSYAPGDGVSGGSEPEPPTEDWLLLETGDAILLENEDELLLESA